MVVMKRPLIGIMLILMLACKNQEPPAAQAEAVPPLQPHMGMAISEDPAKLKQWLRLEQYPPVHVVYQWNGRNTSGMEAALYYDEKTYGAILNAYMGAGFPKGNYSKEQFAFAWLDSAQYAELQYSKPDYTGNPDIFLGTGGKGMLWFLDKKILLKVKP
ncbi:hypothetical protein K7B07_16050 [Niabella sp. 3A5MI-3]|nr:hypothetical protein [Niabella beijingensis]